MKHSCITIAVLFFVVMSSVVFAGIGKDTEKTLSKELIEANYLMGLESENEGLRLSSAYFLGEIKSEKAVIPLLRMLHSDDYNCSRLVAALALIKIGDARGIFQVKQAAIFDDCSRVRRVCKNMYNNYVYAQRFPGSTDLVGEIAVR